MLHITEDTPPDMLSGAMDLTVHLPNGKAVKMAVERSTPMMDLLVQITAKYQLQLSNYTLQALGMAPSAQHSDAVLPFKPNTPIGTLDTQHVKVVPKSRTIPVPKNIPPGHQPFESTFRLKVHLPRNQLYVTRVGRNVLLEDIMNEVCEEKNLNPTKYEFKHPGNPDEVLDPKLTLSDYQITEIYVVLKGTLNLNQAFSSTDIMALRKEEERKQMHNKTGGGVFNLIFRRGKSSLGSGSISSENRSISPTHSDDSRSVTPPNPPQIVAPPPKKDPPVEKPKPPQRKRRPAPKPPGPSETGRRNSEEKPPSSVSESSDLPQQPAPQQARKAENGLTICHSRNSSDSSGYHEASVLSENCNTSLPRRPKSAFVSTGDADKLTKMHSQSTTNLAKMSSHSKSTTSLAVAGRKKKAAPPPPPLVRASNPSINIETPSPVVASQPKDTPATQESILAPPNPSPIPRSSYKALPKPLPRKLKSGSRQSSLEDESNASITIEDVNSPVELCKDNSATISATNYNVKTIQKDDLGVTGSTEIKNETFISQTIQKMVEIENNCEDISKPQEIADLTIFDVNESNIDEENLISNKHTRIIATLNLAEQEDAEYVRRRSSARVPKVDNEAVIDELLKEMQLKCNLEESSKQVNTSLKNVNESIPIGIVDFSQEELSSDILETSCVDLTVLQHSSKEEVFKSEEFLGKKPPEVIALIPKTPQNGHSLSRFDSSGSRRFHIGPVYANSLDAPTSLTEEGSSDSKLEAPFSSLSFPSRAYDSIDQLSDLDEDVFSHPNQQLQMDQRRKKISVTSLRSINNVSDFIGGAGLKKWNNIEDLDHDSLASLGPNSKWVAGDSSGPESLASQQALDSLASLTISDIIRHENKCFGSTDSGIAQETIEKISEPDEAHSISPPPPPLFEEQSESTVEPSAESNELAEESIQVLPAPENFAQTELKSLNESLDTQTALKIIDPPKDIRSIEHTVVFPEVSLPDPEVSDIDWHYQLPSPPKAFRDSSPVNLVAGANLESQSLTDFKDSVVTSPELFEKLQNIEDDQSEKSTISSDLTSIVSEEEKTPLLNTLSLEHLEKRKSLVYNRELATSLKMTDNDIVDKNNEAETFSSSLTKFESVYREIQNSSQSKQQTAEIKFVKRSNVPTHTLPNFKISTYDKPKQKIKVFEDDTVRSNTENINRANALSESNTFVSPLRKSYLGRSMESISMRKNSIDNLSSYSNEEKEYTFYKPESTVPKTTTSIPTSVSRSESFSKDNIRSPVKPVSRSKSHLTLNGNKFKENSTQESILRSNSFYDGLQSIGVMKLIQNKLNTPTSSMENIAHHDSQHKKLTRVSATTSPNEAPQKPEEADKQKPPPAPEKVYKYRGPPSVNMSTWSERPKIPVAVKEDADYILGNNNVSSKLIVNTTNNNVMSNNTVEVKNRADNTASINVNGFQSKETNGVSIKVKGQDNVNTNNSRNLVIKIGSQQSKALDNQRFISHTTAAGYRKPFNNINTNQRPHSIALDSDFDISRVPVVRSVELKKPYKDINNTSVTQIYQGDNYKSNNITTEPVSELMSKFSTMNKSTDTLSSRTYLNRNLQEKEPRPVFRANSLRPQVAPVVRGFNSINKDNGNTNNRFSWNTSNSYSTLPAKSKEKDNFSTNTRVPFSQLNLRRTESSKIMDRNNYNKEKEESPVDLVIDTNSYHSLPVAKQEFKAPPPPPSLPKLKPVKKMQQPVGNPRDELMSAIRDFGGKKGLKAIKT